MSSLPHFARGPTIGSQNEPIIAARATNDASWGGNLEKRLVRKVDGFLLPMAWAMHLLSWFDRQNVSYAFLAGMKSDLHMEDYQYKLSVVCFFTCYTLFSLVSNLIMVRVRPSLYLSTMMILWGICTASMGAIQTVPQLLVVRCLVGLAEAGLTPGITFIISVWYKPQEQGKRMALYASSSIVASAIGGLVTRAVGHHQVQSLAGWRFLFVVEGIVTITWGIAAIFSLPDLPGNWWRLNGQEKQIASRRLEQVGGVVDPPNTRTVIGWRVAIEIAAYDARTWAMALGFALTGGSMGIVSLFPLLISALNYGDHKADLNIQFGYLSDQVMLLPIQAVALISIFVSGFFADSNRLYPLRSLIMASWMAFAFISCAICSLCYKLTGNFTWRYLLALILLSSCWSTWVIGFAQMASIFRNMPREVRAFAAAVPISAISTGNLYAVYLFSDVYFPEYRLGFAIMTVTQASAALCFAVIYFMLRMSDHIAY